MPSWRPVVFSLLAFVIIPMLPTALRGVLPITATIILVVGALAVCGVIGWWKGGSALFALIWVALFGWMLWSSRTVFATSGAMQWVNDRQGIVGYGALVQGWTLSVVALFGLASILTPNQSFLVRGLSAVGIAVVIGFVLTIMIPNGIDRAESIVRDEYTGRVSRLVGEVEQARKTPQWRDLATRYPMLDSAMSDNEARLQAMPKRGAMLMPALLALESLAALALGWALYHRLANVPIGPSLGRLREFRFNDQLVWGLAVGATIAFLPPFVEARSAGINLLVFFGTLYLLRGVGVLSWVSRGRGVATVLIVLTAIAPPLVAALALGVGVGDTWMDWRSRTPSATA